MALFRRPQPAEERKHRKQIHKAVLPRLFDKRGNIAQTKVACFQKGSGGWGDGGFVRGDLASKRSRGALTQTCERGWGVAVKEGGRGIIKLGAVTVVEVASLT